MNLIIRPGDTESLFYLERHPTEVRIHSEIFKKSLYIIEHA